LVDHCLFQTNIGSLGAGAGGALSSSECSNIVITGSDFICNVPGGISLNTKTNITSIITHCTFVSNSAGAGLRVGTVGNCLITNCCFSNNTANGGPSAIYMQSGPATVKNCVITRNYVTNNAMGNIYMIAGSLVQNCIIEDNINDGK
jgi:hypothetical protein